MSQDSDIKALDELFQEVGSYRSSKDFRELFEFIKKFPKTAPFNAFLVHIQKPGSEYFASASEWKEKYGRTIKPGARPLVILWPFGPVRFVFELEDTEGKAPFPQELLRPFQSQGAISESALDYMIKNLPRHGVSYHEADQGTASAGSISEAEKPAVQYLGEKRVKILYNLVINKNLLKEEKFATIAHELGHLFCGHLGTPNEKLWPDCRNLHINASEFEAESVSWLVCERAGIKNPSAQYLSGYLNKDETIPEISLENILKAVGMIESMTLRSTPLRKELIV